MPKRQSPHGPPEHANDRLCNSKTQQQARIICRVKSAKWSSCGFSVAVSRGLEASIFAIVRRAALNTASNLEVSNVHGIRRNQGRQDHALPNAFEAARGRAEGGGYEQGTRR